jgi:hypothetical protein
VQGRYVRDMSEDGSYTREDGCETDDRVQRRDGLRELGGSDSSADQSAWVRVSSVNTHRSRVTKRHGRWYIPTRAPTAAMPPNCAITSGENPAAASDARIPEDTPRIPRRFPVRAVACEARPEIEPAKTSVSQLTYRRCPKTYQYKADCSQDSRPVPIRPCPCLQLQ